MVAGGRREATSGYLPQEFSTPAGVQESLVDWKHPLDWEAPAPLPGCIAILSLVTGPACSDVLAAIRWHNAVESGTRLRLSDVTRILESIEHGDSKAADELLPLVYAELRKLAAAKMANEAPNQTLQPTALVHEAWLRLVGDGNPSFANRAHFFSAAAEAMRRILIDSARRKRAARHGGEHQRVDIEQADIAIPDWDADQLLAVNEALDRLAAVDTVEAELVKLRYFVGLTIDEAAAILGISPRTAKNYWTHARAWLFREIKKGTA